MEILRDFYNNIQLYIWPMTEERAGSCRMITLCMRRIWSWVADRIEYVAMSIRLAIVDKVCGPEPPTDADQQREAEYERLQRAFPSLETDRKGQKR
jgi:hypothetical protein